jgi:hypothetical protein
MWSDRRRWQNKFSVLCILFHLLTTLSVAQTVLFQIIGILVKSIGKGVEGSSFNLISGWRDWKKKKQTRKPQHDSQFLGLDLNMRPTEYKTGVPTIWKWHSEKCLFKKTQSINKIHPVTVQVMNFLRFSVKTATIQIITPPITCLWICNKIKYRKWILVTHRWHTLNFRYTTALQSCGKRVFIEMLTVT